MKGLLARSLVYAAGVVVGAVSALTAVTLVLAHGPSAAQLAMIALLFAGALTLSHVMGRPVAAGALVLLAVAPGLVLLGVQLAQEGVRAELAGVGASLAAAALAGAAGGPWLERRVQAWRPAHSVAVLFTMAAVLLIVIGPVMIRFPAS